MWSVARRPRWIAALLLALGVATGFAALGQWQLARSVESGIVANQETETVVSLNSIAEPQRPVEAVALGQLVRFGAEFVPEDYVVLSDRINLSAPGYWVVGHAVVADGSSIAVALGWADTADAASSAIRTLKSNPPAHTVTGRYLPSESPQESDFEAGRHSALAVAELVNSWGTPPHGVYGGYVVSATAAAGLERIDSPPPSTEVSLNLLNIFYAAEWVIFAGFAIFLWYRVVRDVWEAEQGLTERP
jgi:cytochrome oxidase assembly protein ShyY1